MAGATAVFVRNHPDVTSLLEILNTPGLESQRNEYTSILDYVDTITAQYNTILTELTALKEKVGEITDRKNPFAVMTENLENLASDIGIKLKNLKDSIISFAKNALDTVKEKGLSALGSVFGFLHVRDGLQAMSRGLSKSVEALDKAVARVDNLEQHNREKTAGRDGSEAVPPAVEQAASLAELLADTRLDFENLSRDELKAVYEKLLAIGMDNGLTANENTCLSSLVEEVGSLLPDRGDYEPGREAETEAEQGAEM
jgi:hypothetical protein